MIITGARHYDCWLFTPVDNFICKVFELTGENSYYARYEPNNRNAIRGLPWFREQI